MLESLEMPKKHFNEYPGSPILGSCKSEGVISVVDGLMVAQGWVASVVAASASQHQCGLAAAPTAPAVTPGADSSL